MHTLGYRPVHFQLWNGSRDMRHSYFNKKYIDMEWWAPKCVWLGLFLSTAVAFSNDTAVALQHNWMLLKKIAYTFPRSFIGLSLLEFSLCYLNNPDNSVSREPFQNFCSLFIAWLFSKNNSLFSVPPIPQQCFN